VIHRPLRSASLFGRAEYVSGSLVLATKGPAMTFPTVTEITPRPEPVTPDPFIFAVSRPAPRPVGSQR